MDLWEFQLHLRRSQEERSEGHLRMTLEASGDFYGDSGCFWSNSEGFKRPSRGTSVAFHVISGAFKESQRFQRKPSTAPGAPKIPLKRLLNFLECL